jgi:cytochrome c oxidase assembly protein subunit 15
VPGGYVVGNTHFFGWQVALEWTHRLLAGVVGASVVGLAGYSFMRPKREWLPLGVVVFLLIIQGLLGGLTVLRANVPWSVAIHLATAMLFFGSLLWLRRTVAAGEKIKPYQHVKGVKIFAWGLVALVLLLMSVGGFVSSSHAGGVCGGLFSCAGDWFPKDLQQHSHMMHRYLALALVLATGGYISVIKRLGDNLLRRAALVVHLMVWGQVALGVVTLYSFSDYPAFYELLSVAHLGWGTLVYMMVLGNVMLLYFGPAGRAHVMLSDAPVVRKRRKKTR